MAKLSETTSGAAMTFLKISALCSLAALSACSIPARPQVPAGQLGLVMDLTAFNRGQCDVVGDGFAVEKTVVLNGDYFKVVGNIYNSQLVCTLDNGQRVRTVTHHQFYDQGQFTYAAIVVGRILGAGETEIYGYNDGPNGKVDVNGFFVFEAY
ncbi:hypothetical protein FHS72_001790 [Loktanella ponticola]|uniref:Lipoprotein n=2 Tax=Yoonia ponticola TaxID=1524255 RepID=A0A7W9BKE6_9RHOB|nr:hypothetical protein [Yoonia ponticola]